MLCPISPAKTSMAARGRFRGWGILMGLLKRRGMDREFGLFSNLRFRSKIMLGFAAVLGVCGLSMATADLGFDRIAAGSASYQAIVAQSARPPDIDRQ